MTKTEVKRYRIDIQCLCGANVAFSSRKETSPSGRYKHECTGCGDESWLDTIYPYFEQEDVE